MKSIKNKLSEAAKILGSIKSENKLISSRNNGKKGGYWSHKKNKNKACNQS